MIRRTIGAIVLTAAMCIAGCRTNPTPTSVPTAAPTATVRPTSTPTLTPTPASTPTPGVPAPEEAFADVGSMARFSGEGGHVAGRAVLAGLQTIILREFDFDGQCSSADIRLGKEGEFDQPAAVLVELEARSYVKELFVLTIPPGVTADNADSIAVYCRDTGEVVDWGLFRYQEANSAS